jgi:hypothetical protein
MIVLATWCALSSVVQISNLKCLSSLFGLKKVSFGFLAKAQNVEGGHASHADLFEAQLDFTKFVGANDGRNFFAFHRSNLPNQPLNS